MADSEGNTIESSLLQISERFCSMMTDNDPNTNTFEMVPFELDKREDNARSIVFRTSCSEENAGRGKWFSIIYESEASIGRTSMNSC